MTTALKKAIKDIMTEMPVEGAMCQVHGAAVIGLQMNIKDKVLSPEVTFWSNLKPEYAILMLKEILTRFENDINMKPKPTEVN